MKATTRRKQKKRNSMTDREFDQLLTRQMIKNGIPLTDMQIHSLGLWERKRNEQGKFESEK